VVRRPGQPLIDLCHDAIRPPLRHRIGGIKGQRSLPAAPLVRSQASGARRVARGDGPGGRELVVDAPALLCTAMEEVVEVEPERTPEHESGRFGRDRADVRRGAPGTLRGTAERRPREGRQHEGGCDRLHGRKYAAEEPAVPRSRVVQLREPLPYQMEHDSTLERAWDTGRTPCGTAAACREWHEQVGV